MDQPLLLAVALLPPLASAVWFYRRDRYREPLGAVVGAFLSGLLVVALALYLARHVLALHVHFHEPWFQAGYLAFALAAVPEELAKFVFLRVAIRSRHCDEPMDGMVYGAMVSLGFAAVENVLYVQQGGIVTGAMRAVTAVPMHASCGALMGLALVRAKLRRGGVGAGLLPALAVPILLHGFYDWPLLAIHRFGGVGAGEFALASGLALVVLAVGIVRVRRHSSALRRSQGG